MVERSDAEILKEIRPDADAALKAFDNSNDVRGYLRFLFLSAYRRGMKAGYAEGFVDGEKAAISKVA